VAEVDAEELGGLGDRGRPGLRLSGPRTVTHTAAACRVTTISHWLAAAEMMHSAVSGPLWVCHVSVTSGELGRRVDDLSPAPSAERLD
jgi:hypothetical protein